MHEIVLSPGAEKSLSRLQKSDRRLFRQLAAALDQLSENPHLGKALVGNLKGYYSHRVRDYRILYTIEADLSRVAVLKVEHRREAYR